MRTILSGRVAVRGNEKGPILADRFCYTNEALSRTSKRFADCSPASIPVRESEASKARLVRAFNF
jgi:hypothetical protein